MLRLTITGMACGGWENNVKRALLQVEGVEGVTASYRTNLVGVAYDASKVTPAALRERIQALGYDVVSAY